MNYSPEQKTWTDLVAHIHDTIHSEKVTVLMKQLLKLDVTKNQIDEINQQIQERQERIEELSTEHTATSEGIRDSLKALGF